MQTVNAKVQITDWKNKKKKMKYLSSDEFNRHFERILLIAIKIIYWVSKADFKQEPLQQNT